MIIRNKGLGFQRKWTKWANWVGQGCGVRFCNDTSQEGLEFCKEQDEQMVTSNFQSYEDEDEPNKGGGGGVTSMEKGQQDQKQEKDEPTRTSLWEPSLVMKNIRMPKQSQRWKLGTFMLQLNINMNKRVADGQRNKTIQLKSSDEKNSNSKWNLIRKLCEQKGGWF